MSQFGTPHYDFLQACVETADGNVVVAGYSQGSLDGSESDGYHDIVAAKLDVNTGKEIWFYQVRRTI